MTKLRVNLRVVTPQGTGVIAYVRNGPPSYTEVIAASVILDKERNRPGYTGTIFEADKITPEDETR